MNQNQRLSESLRLKSKVATDDDSSLWEFTQTLRPYLRQVVRSQLNGKLPEKFDDSDVVQAALTQAVKNIGQFHGSSKEEWKAWLTVICQNESRNAIRHWLQQRRNATAECRFSDAAKLAGEVSSVSSKLRRQEQTENVLRGISGLTEDQQMLIQWRNFEDLSHEEIAQKLGISVDAARKRWQATLIQLRKNLNRQNSSPSD